MQNQPKTQRTKMVFAILLILQTVAASSRTCELCKCESNLVVCEGKEITQFANFIDNNWIRELKYVNTFITALPPLKSDEYTSLELLALINNKMLLCDDVTEFRAQHESRFEIYSDSCSAAETERTTTYTDTWPAQTIEDNVNTTTTYLYQQASSQTDKTPALISVLTVLFVLLAICVTVITLKCRKARPRIFRPHGMSADTVFENPTFELN